MLILCYFFLFYFSLKKQQHLLVSIAWTNLEKFPRIPWADFPLGRVLVYPRHALFSHVHWDETGDARDPLAWRISFGKMVTWDVKTRCWFGWLCGGYAQDYPCRTWKPIYGWTSVCEITLNGSKHPFALFSQCFLCVWDCFKVRAL